MKYYAIYLRKSRADMDAEARGEGETLERHRTALRALADRRGLHVLREYAEIVTGDSIAARPQMQALLEDVKQGLYAGVIVNDVDRLGRGDSIDQEIIKYTFTAARCLIITPSRDIDPAEPSDEDMLDFSMFFARFEYRKISKRLSLGRTRSAQAGNYISPRVPYGYMKVSTGKQITLIPDPETAEIVRMIFDMYSTGTMGYNAIAQNLNRMGVKTSLGNTWSRASVKTILTNPVYTGRIVWGNTMSVSAIEDGRRVKKHIKGDPLVVEHAHPAIISEEMFQRVQKMFAQTRHASSTNIDHSLVNPLAGLVYCSECGKAMQLRGGRKARGRLLACTTYGCPTRGTYVSIVMDSLLDVLDDWCARYSQPDIVPTVNPMQEIIARQTAQIEAQLAKAMELVELGVYTPSEYLERKRTLQDQLDALQQQRLALPLPKEEAITLAVPAIKHVLDVLPHTESIEEQNALLRTVVERIEYHKTETAKKKKSASLLSLDVYPKVGCSV